MNHAVLTGLSRLRRMVEDLEKSHGFNFRASIFGIRLELGTFRNLIWSSWVLTKAAAQTFSWSRHFCELLQVCIEVGFTFWLHHPFGCNLCRIGIRSPRVKKSKVSISLALLGEGHMMASWWENEVASDRLAIARTFSFFFFRVISSPHVEE